MRTQRLFGDPEVVWGPGGFLGTRRLSGDPEVAEEPEGSPLDPEITLGTQRSF